MVNVTDFKIICLFLAGITLIQLVILNEVGIGSVGLSLKVREVPLEDISIKIDLNKNSNQDHNLLNTETLPQKPPISTTESTVLVTTKVPVESTSASMSDEELKKLIKEMRFKPNPNHSLEKIKEIILWKQKRRKDILRQKHTLSKFGEKYAKVLEFSHHDNNEVPTTVDPPTESRSEVDLIPRLVFVRIFQMSSISILFPKNDKNQIIFS